MPITNLCCNCGLTYSFTGTKVSGLLELSRALKPIINLIGFPVRAASSSLSCANKLSISTGFKSLTPNTR